ncbi:MAG TPA: SAM-dependent chlorinase/fluorinase [Solirubrobacteraceae bacterium]|nr:SAM-dependent chlorinase/fluorinase [Solirubrobacteraceae bacterium]
MSAPIITFLSDYGLEDDFVGICHAVIAGVCPEARVIDLVHWVPRGDVRAGAVVLRGALPYLPVGVHLAVVDPGVGGDRRGVAVRTADGRMLVGPDNGLLLLATERAGGVVEAVDIGASPFALGRVSATFHGRDIFAPVAARLAAGAALGQAGEPCDPGGLVALELPVPRVEGGFLVANVLYVDRFGNVQLDVEEPAFEVGATLEVIVGSGRSERACYTRTFADAGAGELILYEDSYRRLAVAVNQGDAATRLGLTVDDEFRIRLM